MPRDITWNFKVYKFEELSDEAKERVLEDNRYVLVEDYAWYDFIYDEADMIGIEIEGFDLYEGYIKIKLNTSVLNSVESAMQWFGESTEEYKLVKSYYDAIMKLADSDEVKEYLEENPDDDAYDAIYNMSLDDRFYNEYISDMKRLFLKMLEDTYDYLISDEAIIKYFDNNDYEFFENGKVFNAFAISCVISN